MSRKILMLFVLVLCGCSGSSDLDTVVKKDPSLAGFIGDLKTSGLIYEKCDHCELIGLDGEMLIGHTDRYPPKGHYDKKVLAIGEFEYDVFFIFDKNEGRKVKVGIAYFCYLSPMQKISFVGFFHYYSNLIMHGKLIPKVEYIGSTLVMDFYIPS